MKVVTKNAKYVLLLSALSLPVASLSAQELEPEQTGASTIVYGERLPNPEDMAEGPKIEGIVTARKGEQFQVTQADGTRTVLALSEYTTIKASGGFLGLDKDTLTPDSLMNGLPVTVETWQWDGGLVASKVSMKAKDLKTATMIQTGTAQQFAEQGAAINENAAATEALRGRMGDIDQYNIKSTTNVYFDSGKWEISPLDEITLCATAREAETMDNSLLLVVGYTDSTGSQEVNQRLSEKRAGRVVNYLQQACGWKPWRMLTPTGMAEADPAADNYTEEGKAQNRRVSVNILVSKALDGM